MSGICNSLKVLLLLVLSFMFSSECYTGYLPCSSHFIDNILPKLKFPCLYFFQAHVECKPSLRNDIETRLSVFCKHSLSVHHSLPPPPPPTPVGHLILLDKAYGHCTVENKKIKQFLITVSHPSQCRLKILMRSQFQGKEVF